MTKIIIAVAAAITIGGLLWVYLSSRDAANVRKGIDQQVAAEIAKANQQIATRRAKDATFDKMDAAAFCRDAGLEWVFDDGKSYCQ